MKRIKEAYTSPNYQTFCMTHVGSSVGCIAHTKNYFLKTTFYVGAYKKTVRRIFPIYLFALCVVMVSQMTAETLLKWSGKVTERFLPLKIPQTEKKSNIKRYRDMRIFRTSVRLENFKCKQELNIYAEKPRILPKMQLNRTYLTFDDFIEYFLPSSIFRVYRGIKKAYKASKLFANVFIINLFMIFYRKNKKATDLYRKVWRKWDSDKESKDIDKDVSSIRPFKISVPDSVLDDLKSRLGRARLNTPSRKDNFYNGFNPEHLRKLKDYWKTKFDWRKHEQDLNKYPQYKTKIGNIDVHFLHFKAIQHDSELKLIPLLLIHNWPGSFADFQKVIPILQTSCEEHGFVFEIVCPSIPGCGFSEAPHQSEFSATNLSEVLLSLMDRLGYARFYVHGYGCGAVTASLMARYHPYRVKGLHVNMCFALPNLFDSFIKTLVVSICPIFINKAEYNIIFPLKKKIRMLFQETGFLHMQCTKPDTFGYAMTDSPIALTIHVLERFHFKKNSEHLELQDGDLTGEFLDDLLTLVTILWTSNDFTNGARFFKQCMSDVLQRTHENGIPLIVPCGVAFFPDEIFMLPKYMMESMVEDLVSYTVMPSGGHFPAIEEPQLLAEDICKFVQVVENRSALKIKSQR